LESCCSSSVNINFLNTEKNSNNNNTKLKAIIWRKLQNTHIKIIIKSHSFVANYVVVELDWSSPLCKRQRFYSFFSLYLPISATLTNVFNCCFTSRKTLKKSKIKTLKSFNVECFYECFYVSLLHVDKHWTFFPSNKNQTQQVSSALTAHL
jgi:hypothetical protein